MCGIFALLGDSSRLGNSNDLTNIDNILNSFNKGKHRGPEFSKLTNVMLKATFGFHRLAINGLNDKSNQPLIYKDIVLICNGEIYNYKELYNYMNISIANIQSDSDCEVIIHMYLRYGIEHTLRMLDGVFSFCLIDYRISNEESKMYVARDPYGVRPLYIMKPTGYGYSKLKDNYKYIFASELKMINDIYQILNNDDEFRVNFAPNNKPLYTVSQFEPGTYTYIDMKHTVSPKWHIKRNNIRYHTPGFSFELFGFQYSNTESEVLMLSDIRKRLHTAVFKRCMTTDRPIACLLSGGLDSSLITALVNESLKTINKQSYLETYSIGIKGSEDLKYSQIVADYLGTKHTQIELEESDFINAIPNVIYDIESYDTTTVRASLGNWLIGKYISENSEAKVIFNGDGSDELTGGYLYVNKAPDEIEFDKECRKLLKNIHLFDVLRSDKCISSHGLEPRTPFLDRGWIQFYLSLPLHDRSNFQNRGANKKFTEKYLLRKAFSEESYKRCNLQPLLPDSIIWRQKEAFSDGVSEQNRSLKEIVGEFAEKYIKENVFNNENTPFVPENLDYSALSKMHTNMQNLESHLIPKTAEQFYYRMIFEKHYNGLGKILPNFWMPKYINCNDPSARTLNIYNQDESSESTV